MVMVWCETDEVPAPGARRDPASVVSGVAAVESPPPAVVEATKRYQVVAPGATALVTA